MHALDFINSRYEKIRLLKQNDRSTVWLAADQQEQLVILKRLQQTSLPLRLLKDAQIPLLPKLYYIAESNTETITVEEYITGQSLAQYKYEGKFLTPHEAKKILLALCTGLAALHDLGIIHRDIKPAHILIEKNGTPRLIDFDTCRLIKDSQREDTELLGTKTYAPPEQFGFRQTDCRSDIYALGQTINELLPPDYRGKLRSILNRCQRLDPADRYQTMQELAKAIKRPALNKKAAALLLLAAIVLSFCYYYRSQPPETEHTAATTTTAETPPSPPTAAEQPVKSTTPPPATDTANPQPVTTAATATPATATIPAPQPASQAEKPAPAAKADNYIRTQFFRRGAYLNGWMENYDTAINNSGTGIEFERHTWEQAINAQGIMHISPDDVITLRIINQSSLPWNNSSVTLHYKSQSYTDTQTMPLQALAPSEATTITIPLDQYPIINPEKAVSQTIGQLDVEITSDSPQELRCRRFSIAFMFLP